MTNQALNKVGRNSAKYVFLIWRTWEQTMYQGTRPPEKSMVMKIYMVNHFLYFRQFLESGYANIEITVRLSREPIMVTQIVTR
jgi:hypothetical protein